MATNAVTPDRFFTWIQALDNKIRPFGVKTKTILVQGLRDFQGESVCFALMEKWIKTGLISNANQRKAERKAFRSELESDESKHVPQDIQERQKEYLGRWPTYLLDNLPTELETATIGGALAGITALNYKPVGEGNWPSCNLALKQSLADQVLKKVAADLALNLRTAGDTTKTAFFHLRLVGQKGGRSRGHAVGLKRGKNNNPRHYSLFDANTWEVTNIQEKDLEEFLGIYAMSCWHMYSSYKLFQVSALSI